MAMNRRNVLIGLGTVAAGGGAALGTGAFSQVEAGRTVSIATSGDDTAQVQLDLDSALDAGGDTIEFSESDINADAVTTYDNGLTVTIPTSSPKREYTLEIQDGDENDLLKDSATKTDSGDELQLVNGSVDTTSNPNSATLDNDDGSAGSIDLDVVVNTIGTESDGESIGVSTIDITVK